MSSNCKSALKTAGAGLAVALAAGACAVLTPRGDHYVPPPVGSAWIQSLHDTGSYGSGDKRYTFTHGERIWRGDRVNAFEGPEGTIIAALDGGWLAIVQGEKTVVSWDPPVNFDYPLEVGKSWTKSSSIRIYAANRTIPFSYTGKVEAYENVTVPAGTFKAFRIHWTDTLGNDEILWFSPKLGIFVKEHLVRTAKNASGPGTRDIEVISQNIDR
jgi:hypothetical protein